MAKAKRKKSKKEKKDVRSEITAGSLRERVRAGELAAPDVLAWLREQPYASSDFVRWLERQPAKPTSDDRSDTESPEGTPEACEERAGSSA